MARLHQAAADIYGLERLSASDSPVHRLHPMPKLIVTVAYIVAVVSFHSSDISGLTQFLLYPAVLMPLSGTPCGMLAKRLLIALPFPLFGGMSNVFFSTGTAFYLGNIAVSHGAVSFASIMLKTLLSVLAVLLLIAATPLAEICRQLERLRLPRALCLQLVMTYRYLSVLLSEAAGMNRAYNLRAPGQKGIRMRDMGSFLGQLILKSFDRAERVAAAMECRGFSGGYSRKDGRRLRASDWAYLLFVLGAIALLRLYNVSLFFGRLVG